MVHFPWQRHRQHGPEVSILLSTPLLPGWGSRFAFLEALIQQFKDELPRIKDGPCFYQRFNGIDISGALPTPECSWPQKLESIRQPVSNKSQPWKFLACSQSLPNNYAAKCSNCPPILMLIPISIIPLDLYDTDTCQWSKWTERNTHRWLALHIKPALWDRLLFLLV